MTLARACRDAVRVRFHYAGRDSGGAVRTVEPVRMVAAGRRWYLMAWDVDRDDWRTFRLDRMREAITTTWRFQPRAHPDPVAYVQQSVVAAPYRYVARARVQADADQARGVVPPSVGRVEDNGAGWCLLTTGGDDPEWLAMHLARMNLHMEVLGPPEVREAAARLSRRLAGMAGG